MAEAEISSGRRDAKKLTIVVTDGRPLSMEATEEAAISLRERSRLMFVAVTEQAPIEAMEQWATFPPEENVLAVPDFSALKDKETVNHIISQACPELDDKA